MSTAAIIPMKWHDNPCHDSVARCACCDRPLKANHKWVEVIDGGSSVANPGLGPDTNDSGYMGFYPVGSSCAKKWFHGFTHDSI
jgi:hypothetical protein